MLELFLFIFGLLIGSFLNVCIYRLPREESIVVPPSHCPVCNTRLKPLDLIPVLSFLFLKGKCHYCQSPISPRYAGVELLTGMLFVIGLKVMGLTYALIPALVFAAFMVVIIFIDLDHQLILDKVLIPFALLGLVFNIWLQSVSYLSMLIGALVGGGLLLLIALLSRGGMGGGDIKFAAALGIWLGWQYVLLTLFLAFVAGGVSGLLLLVLKLKQRKDMIPFGPFIALGALCAWWWGKVILNWYFGFI